MPVTGFLELNREIGTGLSDPKIKQRVADLRGGVPMLMTSAEFQKFIAAEAEKVGQGHPDGHKPEEPPIRRRFSVTSVRRMSLA